MATPCVRDLDLFVSILIGRQGLPLRLTTYAIIPITATSGLLETVSGAVSIDSLKKRLLENNRLYHSHTTPSGTSAAPTLADHFNDRQVSVFASDTNSASVVLQRTCMLC